MTAYDLRPVTEADLPLLTRWRAAPQVVRWWGPPEVEDPAETPADPRVAMWIVAYQGRPFAAAGHALGPRRPDGALALTFVRAGGRNERPPSRYGVRAQRKPTS